VTTRENRGGSRVPDGVPRPANIPFGRGPNRQDLAELPGTPGTPLPEGIGGGVPTGQVGPIRRALADIPLESFGTGGPGILSGESTAPEEPLTAGIDTGAGPGAGSVLPSPVDLSNRFTASELQAVYPVLMRLATLPGATTQTKILAQKLRANLPVKPEQVPRVPQRVEGEGPPLGSEPLSPEPEPIPPTEPPPVVVPDGNTRPT
jgi:hypothetical protein